MGPLFKVMAVYYAAVNILLFALMGIDKVRAKRGQWRIREATLAAVSLLQGCNTGLGSRRGKYIPDHPDVKHAFSHEPGTAWFMPGAAHGYYGHAVRTVQLAVDHQMVFLQAYQISVGDGQSFQQLIRKRVGIVDEFFHCHIPSLLSYSYCSAFCFKYPCSKPSKKRLVLTAPASGVPIVLSP